MNMDQGMCCSTSSSCTGASGPLDSRLTTSLPAKTFICSDRCMMDGANTEHCDEEGQKLCTVGPPITLNPGQSDTVAAVPTCAWELVCPPCHKPNEDCTDCVVDWTAPQNCDPCAEDADTIARDSRCAAEKGDYAYKCCSPDSECTKVGGVLDTRTNDAFNPSNFICSKDCGSGCDEIGKICSLYNPDDIALPIGSDNALENMVSACSGGR